MDMDIGISMEMGTEMEYIGIELLLTRARGFGVVCLRCIDCCETEVLSKRGLEHVFVFFSCAICGCRCGCGCGRVEVLEMCFAVGITAPF